MTDLFPPINPQFNAQYFAKAEAEYEEAVRKYKKLMKPKLKDNENKSK